MVNNVVYRGPGVITILGCLFIALKLMGYISWSWIWVLSLFWIPLGIAILFLIITVLVIIVAIFKNVN